MKRIEVDYNLTHTVKIFNDSLFSENKVVVEVKLPKRIGRKKIRVKKTRGKHGFKLPKIGILKLYKEIGDNGQKLYLRKLFKEYDDLLNIKPSEFGGKKNEFDGIYRIDGVKGSESTNFGIKVVEALRYDAFRETQYPKIINNLGWNLKACFYCNYAGTLTVLKTDKDFKTYYDLDHVMPKSTYPFLAISFFNFIPSCATCNRNKSNKIITNLNPFYEQTEVGTSLGKVFEITNKSKLLFYNNLNKDLIEIKVADTINNVSKTELGKIVDLELLYNNQQHEVEEILWKKKVHSKAYLESVQSSFSRLNLKKYEINRILWGADLNEETINDRPLAKFKFDIINDR